MSGRDVVSIALVTPPFDDGSRGCNGHGLNKENLHTDPCATGNGVAFTFIQKDALPPILYLHTEDNLGAETVIDISTVLYGVVATFTTVEMRL